MPWQCKKVYSIIQSQLTIYGKFVNFYQIILKVTEMVICD